MIRVHCTHCGKLLRVADSLAGRQGKCPHCGNAVAVPSMPALAPGGRPPRKRAKTAFVSLLPPPRPADHEEWIDMTSMVDIVFFLLIFFMVTSLNTQQASIESPVPESRRAASEGRAQAVRTVADFENDEDFIIARIDADNTVWIEDAAAPSPAEVLSKLRAAMRGAGGKGAPSRLLVLAHGDAHHGTAVMVLDAAQEAGLVDVRLAVRDEE